MSDMVWIVVPAGHAGDTGALQAHVVITPRLDAETLAEAGMASWPPPELATAKVSLVFAAAVGDEPAATLDATVRPEAEPRLWSRYFPADVRIRAAEGAGDPPAIEVQPAGDDGAAAEAIFHEAAEAPIGEGGEPHVAMDAAVTAALERHPLAPLLPPPDLRAARLAPPEELDFHDLVGMVREHPTVQKALGLILTLDLPAPPASVPAKGIVQVVCTGLPATVPPIVSPWTAYQLTGGRFMAQSAGTVESGMVRIADAVIGEPANRVAAAERLKPADGERSQWRVLTVDVDSAAGAIRDLSRRVAARSRDAAMPTLPALRSGGIALARADAGDAIHARGARVRAARANEAETPLDAEDLLLGLRLDVKREGETWKSLSVRRASYLVGGEPIAAGQVIEEGHIKAGAALDYGDGVLRTDDIVARWTGWNHVTRRPGFVASEVDPADADQAQRLGWRFETQPGAQPRLRFGASYRLRLRVADIAGGGLALDDPLAEHQTTGVVSYGRYEPVGSPGLLPADDGTAPPGESVVELVVRSDRGMTPAQFAAANPVYPGKPIRLLEPPRTSIGMAEQHKMLDDMDAGESWAVVAPAITGGDPASRLALPDPAASGVAGFTADLPAPAVLAWPKWPAVEPKRLVLQGRVDPQEPALGWRGDDLTAVLAPAATATIELSSTLREGFESHMAAKLDLKPAAAAAARIGRHPLVTPAITVKVTHATRMPLRDPEGGVDVAREPGETRALLEPQTPLFGIDPASTAKVEISADWIEPDDAETRTVSGRHVKDLMVSPDDDADFAEFVRQEFGDTRHRRVRYNVRAISRFRHCFFADEPDEWFAASLTTEPTSVPSSARPPALKILGATPAFNWTKTPAVGGKAVHVRDGLLRVMLARPWFVTGEGEQLAVILAAAESPAAEVHDLVSEAGRDPVWTTGTPRRWLGPQQFPAAAAPAVTITAPGAATPVQVLPHDVFFDAQLGCWCCDIVVAGLEESYAGLVRLALARYQAESLDGLWLSSIARTDFLPIMPQRTASVEVSGSSATVQLSGLVPTGPSNNVFEVAVEEAAASDTSESGPVILSEDAGLLGWRAIDQVTGLSLNVPNTIQLPSGSGRRRLRLREIESFTAAPAADAASPLAPRIVFEEVFPLT